MQVNLLILWGKDNTVRRKEREKAKKELEMQEKTAELLQKINEKRAAESAAALEEQ